ncbi:cyclase, partial [Mycobacterium sp. ITM-2017-0098]
MTACGSCGTALVETAKFCGECGSPTAVRDNTAKYKQVTVLFADVVRSMDLAAAVDIERLREIMVDFFARSTAVVQRFGGLVEYNGDGVMALFGAPIALEDHAIRGCLAALALQEEASRLAVELQRDDGVALQLRVGLNSGRVITGEIGSGSLGYRATGMTVGMAQRLESVAPPGGVVLSETTARLVEHRTVLAEPEWLRVKGADEPVCVRRLVTVRPQCDLVGRAEGNLVGRRWEMAALDAMVERAIGGRGAIVNVVGPPGIGKSRVAREVAALAAVRGVALVWAFCESHAQDLSFGVIAGLLRASLGVGNTDDREAARVNVRRQIPDADPQDLLLLNDLLGIADTTKPLPQIDADARRRRLTSLIKSVWLARTEPAVYVLEDAHWIDAVSESMLVDLLAVVPRTPSVVLITSRPEYGGALARLSASQAIALAPLSDSNISEITAELLGPDPSVEDLTATIVGRADGNPFFAEEMVRELVQRGVLTGDRGGHICSVSVDEVTVPATVQAAIEARIDRLSPAAKRTLRAASVIGARFGTEFLEALGITPELDELCDVELIDQVRVIPAAEFVFCHPLIRAVAYESQLKSDRAGWHRLLAVALEVAANEAVEERAALIAEHWQAAGDLQVAYGWHMRAAAWSTNRDIAAARGNWERACEIADQLPGDA